MKAKGGRAFVLTTILWYVQKDSWKDKHYLVLLNVIDRVRIFQSACVIQFLTVLSLAIHGFA